MSKMLRISDYSKGGLNSDFLPWDLNPSFLTNLSNIRIKSGKLTPFGGHDTWATMPIDFVAGYLMPAGSISSLFWVIAGEDAVYAFDGVTFSDISNPAGYIGINNEDLWSGCLLSEIPIINHVSHYPEYWPQKSGGVTLEFLPWDATNTWQDVSESARLIRSHRQFLFALDLQSGPDSIPDGVRWSAPADIGGVPPTWDHLDVNNVAGLTHLGGSGGKIIDGRSMRDAFVVYRENAVSVFDYLGGQFVWRVRHLSSTTGLLSQDAIVEVKGSHYYIGDGDIYVNDGSTIKSIIHDRIRDRFIKSFDIENFSNSYVVRSNAATEIWFCIPEVGHVYPNLAYIYNWRDDTWTIRDIPEAPFANYGTQRTPPFSWDTSPFEWDKTSAVWNQNAVSPLDETIVAITKPAGAGQSGELLRLDKSLTGISTDFDCVIERIGIALEGLDDVTTINRVHPHMRGDALVRIQIGSQDFPGAPVRWKPSIEFDPSKDRKIDIRSTGELHCYRIFKNASNDFWEFSGIDIEYVMAGKR